MHLDGDGLRVAVAQPSDDLRFLSSETTGRSVRLQLASVSDIRRAIDRSYQAVGGVGKLVQAFEAVERRRRRDVRPGAAQSAEDAPVVQVVNLIMTQALRDRASDIHIEPQDERPGPVPDRRRAARRPSSSRSRWGSGWSAGSRSWPA